MWLIILIIAIFLLRRYVKKKRLEKITNPFYVKTENDLKQDKKAFERHLQGAGDGNEYGLSCIHNLAKDYGSGIGVERDLTQAVLWKRREMEEKLYWKATLGSVKGPTGFDPEELVDFFINGREFPRDAALASSFAYRLLQAEEPVSVLIFEKIDALKKIGFFDVPNDRESTVHFLEQKSDDGDGYATYQLARFYYEEHVASEYEGSDQSDSLMRKARQQGNLAARCVLYEWQSAEMANYLGAWRKALNERDSKYRKLRVQYLTDQAINLRRRDFFLLQWKKEAKKAGADRNLADSITWALEKAGWPAPAPYCFEAAPDMDFFQRCRKKEMASNDYEALSSDYEQLAKQGHAESMRRLGLIQIYVCSRTRWLGKMYTSGMDWLKKAAEAGDIFAAHELNLEVNPAFMAYLAEKGDCEAILRLAQMVEKGSGGPANPQAAQYLYLLCWNAIGNGNKAEYLTGEELMLKYRLLSCRGLDPQIYRDNYTYWLLLAQKKGYALADYLLMRTAHFGRAFGHDNQRKLAEKALKAGFASAKGVLGFLDSLEKNWKSYVEYKEYNNESPEKIRNSFEIYKEVLRSNGMPAINELRYRGGNKIKPVSMEEVEKTLDESENSKNDEPAEGSVMDMPYYIRDDLLRMWERVQYYWSDTVRYRLCANESGWGMDRISGDDVYISDHQIHGNTAETFLRTFHW